MENLSDQKVQKSILYAGLVWILSAISLAIYALLSAFKTSVPGIEQFVDFLLNIEGAYIYAGAFAAIFIEGLYFVGSFFPGATLVLIFAVLSVASGTQTFFLSLLTVFLGWNLAGVVNIYLARLYRKKAIKLGSDEAFNILDRPWATWFPSFRANYEVAQIVEGGNPVKVFLSSVRVRVYASIAAGIFVFVFSLLVDIDEVSNEEGCIVMIIVITLSLIVGILKIRRYRNLRQNKKDPTDLLDK